MSTELSIINQDELNDFIARTRVSSEDLQGGGDFLPQLKINYLDEIDVNGVKKEAKPGLFTLSGQEVQSFAKNVVFRPLLHNFQYIKYNDVEKKVTNRSVFFTSFSEEARDESGTVRCGKPQSKTLKDNPVLKKQFEDVTLYRSVDGLVSYDGVDFDGKLVKVENVLCSYRGKGSNFSPFQEEYIKLMPKGTLIWDFDLKLGVTKHKQDPKSAATYYVVHFEADFAEKLQFTSELFETVKALQVRINETNLEIDKKYYAAVEARNELSSDVAAANAVDVTPLSTDMEDDSPF